ncbi:TIGR02444 family protein [Halomonas sp. WWR20]
MRDDSTQLWDYALALYARQGVAEACLALQDDAGADVCELLWICWLAGQGLSLADDADQALAGVRAWQRDFTYPLRAQRRTLKPLAASSPGIAQLRQRLKDAELLAEREALRQLQEVTAAGYGIRPTRVSDGDVYARLARHLGAVDDAMANSLELLAGHSLRCVSLANRSHHDPHDV